LLLLLVFSFRNIILQINHFMFLYFFPGGRKKTDHKNKSENS